MQRTIGGIGMQAMIGGTSAVSTEMPSDINSGSFKQRMGFFDAR
jgi:hypothetical protein